MVKVFVERLRHAGITPDEVITDDSRLYPAVVAELWPTAMHQLCLFHATRRVVALSARWSNTSDARCRRHLQSAGQACLVAYARRRRLPTSMTQTPNGIGGAWRGAHWASPRPMRCTNTSRPAGPSAVSSGLTMARSANG
jgi:hypothetical protein